MTPTKSPYPKRPAFFALKFCRLLGKICLAQEIGSEAVLLLMNVALVEDAKSYRSPVTYFNEQLMPLIGVNSHRSLINFRDKAINSGWLHYEPGGKGFAGKYWVTIPAEFERMDDAPVDENPREYADVSTTLPLTKSSAEAKCNRSATVSASVVEAKCNVSGSVNHSSLPVPVPIPDPREEQASLGGNPPATDEADIPWPDQNPDADAEAEPEPAKAKPRAKATGPAAEAIADFCARWKAKYKSETDYVWDYGKNGKSLKKILETVGGVAAKLSPIFARFFADDDPFWAADSRHSFPKFKQNFTRWQVEPPPPPIRRPTQDF